MTPEKFKKHVLFDRLNSFEEILSDEEIKNKIDIEKLSYFQTVFSFISQRMKLTFPDLVQLVEMDSLSSEINEGVNQINSFSGNGNEGHLSNAINNFNAAISKTMNLPIPVSENDFNFSRKIADFEKLSIDKYRNLEKEKDGLEDEIDKLNIEIAKNQGDVKALLELIKGKDTEIESLNSSFQTSFDNIKSQHDQQFSTALKSYSADIEKSKGQFRNEID